MDPSAQQIDKTKRSADILRAELERKKQDLYKVFNPTNQDFQVVLNAAVSPEVWTIQAKEEAIVPWYVAEKYFEEMVNKIITAKSDKAVIKENEERMAKGFKPMDLHTEQFRFESRNLKVMMGKREQIAQVLNRGLYKEFGVGNGKPVDPIQRRDVRDSFDPGVEVGTTVTAQPTPSTPPPAPRPELTQEQKEPLQQVEEAEEEDEDDGVEEIKDGSNE